MKETPEPLSYILCCDRKRLKKQLLKQPSKFQTKLKNVETMEIIAGHGLPACFPASIHLTYTIQVHYALFINFKFVFLFLCIIF